MVRHWQSGLCPIPTRIPCQPGIRTPARAAPTSPATKTELSGSLTFLIPFILNTGASSWPKRVPADGIIDWETRAPYLYDWVRAQTRPYPGAFTFLGGEKVVVWRARLVDWDGEAPAGTVVEAGPVVACGEGALLLEEVETSAPLEVGARLG